ncbi:MAG: hypothetical protein PQJ58_12300 [Spirochaetales bacterium]|nr:hypothetical protein [Spirochaetales bacterium]
MAPELREKELYVFRIEDDIVYASQEYKGYYRVFTFPIEGFTDSTLISRKLVNSETLPRIPFRDGYVGYKEDRGIFFCDRDFNNIEEAKGNDELPSLVFNSLAVKGDDLWVGTSRGLAVSRDGGEHFQIVDTGIDERFNTVAVRIGATGQIEIIQEENPNREKTTFTTGFPNNQNPESSLIVMFGVSYDDGATWSSWSYAGEEPIWRFVRSRSIGNGLRMHSDPERFFPNYNRMEMKPVDRRLTPNSTDLVTLTVTSEEIPSSGAIQWDYLSWDPKVGREYGFPVQRPFIFAREGHLVIGSENDGMAISDDEGQSWRQIRFDGLLKKRLYYSYYAREYTIDFDGSKFLICNGDSLLLSEDAGKSWREIDIGYPLEGEFQSCRILETKMIAHDWKSQYVSEDGGKSWTRTPDEDFFLYDPSFVNNYIPHYRFSDNTDDAILYKFNKRIPPLKKEPVLPDGYKLKEIWEYESTMYALAYMNSESGEKTCILRSEDEGTNWDLFWKKNGHAKIMRLIVQGDEIYLIHGTLVYLLDRNSGRFLGTLGIMDEYVRLGMGSIVPEPDGLFFPYSGVVYRIEKRPENGETIELQISN